MQGYSRANVLLEFTALRVSEVVGATWAEFDLDGVDSGSATAASCVLMQTQVTGASPASA